MYPNVILLLRWLDEFIGIHFYSPKLIEGNRTWTKLPFVYVLW
jgi:hypothetical protein